MRRLTKAARRAFGHTDYRRFIVLARSRTGSYLLLSFLNAHPNVRSDREILHTLHGRDPIDIIARSFGREPRHVKAKGFKVFYYHPNGESGTRVWDHLEAMDGLHVIHLTRRNILRTLISQKIATRQGVWKTDRPLSTTTVENKQVSFTVEELTKGFERTREWEREGEHRFRAHPLLPVTYEDLRADPGGTFRRVTDFLGVPPAEPHTDLVRQNPESVRELVANYDELAEAFRGTEWASFFDDEAPVAPAVREEEART
jgi:LPS sulfotransferase NodH